MEEERGGGDDIARGIEATVMWGFGPRGLEMLMKNCS